MMKEEVQSKYKSDFVAERSLNTKAVCVHECLEVTQG